MKLTTHNTMSYQKPKQLWAKIIPFVARCQSVDYIKQYELGAVGFDLRLFWDKNGNLEFRHGIVSYPADNIWEVLDFIRDHDLYVRVLFELRSYNRKHVNNVETLKTKFKDFCKEIEDKYPIVKFYGGCATCDWEQLYNFKNDEHMPELGLYSSNTSLFKSSNKFLRIIDDLCPWIYAKLMNRKNMKKYKDSEQYISVDFINIQ